MGAQWADHDVRVFVCATLDKAKKMLDKSQKCATLEPHCIWTRISKGSARNIVCEKTHDGLWYTNTPTKICVDGIVYQQEPSVITEADLLENARKVYGKYAQFMLSLQQERKEIKK